MKAEAPLASPYAQVVVDTNVLLSAALLPQSTQALLVDCLLAQSRLITGDQDLLVLHPLGELHLLTPRAALDEIATMQTPTQVER